MYNTNLELGAVVLNVDNLEKQRDFYVEAIGLEVVNESNGKVDLGIKEDSKVLISLKRGRRGFNNSYGLYHIAILVPKRSDLGNVLKHLLKKYSDILQGASDHAYSEAIYLADLEGNGIEIYRDRPMEEWDIHEDGKIVGVTEPLDAEGVLKSADNTGDDYKFPRGTIVGHVHLSSKDANKSSKIYQYVFDMGDKFSVSTASWIANGQYHHHLAFNQWGRGITSKKVEDELGLAYLTIEYRNKLVFEETLERAKNSGLIIIEMSENSFMTEDSDGIRVLAILKES